MKKRIISSALAVTMGATLLAGCGGGSADESTGGGTGDTAGETTGEVAAGDLSSVDFSGEDPQLPKKMKILTIWAEDNDNGILINKICEDYKANVNPNFEWEYEMVPNTNLNQKIATLAASNDLPDLFAYDSGALLKTLIDADKVVNVTEALETVGSYDSLNPGAVELLKGLSGTDEIYDLPLGLNVEGFWYNKELFEKAGCEEPETWEEFEVVLEKLNAAGIQPLTTGGADGWPATRLVNAYATRIGGNDVMTRAANGEIAYTDPALVEAANKIGEWSEKGYFGQGITTVDLNTAGSMLMTGQAAIFYNGSWFTQSLADPAQNPSGDDGIGFFNIPIKDESISSSTSYSMNCGNILCLDAAKYDEATAWFLKYFVENVGNVAMTELNAVKGYNYDVDTDDVGVYTQLVLDEIDKATEGFAWFEAKMPSEVSKTSQENVQTLLNNDMTGEEYMQSIQDVYDLSK